MPWPASTPQSSFAVSAWASKWTMPMLPGLRTSAMAVALGHVIEWSPPSTIGMAPGGGDVTDLAVDERVGALDPGGHDVRVAGVDDLQDFERLDAELEGVDRARRVLRLADRARAEPGARPVAHRVVEWRADDRDIDPLAAQLGGIGDPRQVHEGRGPDVRGQLVVAEFLERLVPAVGGGEAGGGVGVVGALGHVIPPETGAGRPGWPRQGIRLAGGAAGSKRASSGARRPRW